MIAEHQAEEVWQVELEHARQVLTLVAIDERHTVAAEGELSAQHIDRRGAAHAAFGVQDRQRGRHFLEDTRLIVMQRSVQSRPIRLT